MGFFRRDNASSSIFPVQENGQFGRVRTRRDTQVFEEVAGADSAYGDTGARAYLGLTIPRRRFRWGGVILCLVLGVFLARSAQLQIVNGLHYRELAEGNRFRTHVLSPPRGIVYAHGGETLISNISTFVLTMTLADLPIDPTERDDTLMRAADFAGVHRADLDLLITQYANSPREAVPVRKNLDYESAMRLAIAMASLPGFHLETSSTRAYETSAVSLSHVLGYMGKITGAELEVARANGYRPTDEIGKTGVEEGAEHLLRGVPGKLEVEVDARGHEIAMVSREEPVPGASVTLAVDVELQRYIEERLAVTLQTLNLKRGVVIAMDPQSGGVRAMVSLPSYDSNAFAAGIDQELYSELMSDEDLPLFARAISGEYPAGSTFKPFVAYAALTDGIVTPSTSFLSVGGLNVGGSRFPDWKPGGHGVTDVRKAIAESVNTYFYIIGGGFDRFTGLGVDRIISYAKEFGFGSRTGIDLPGEADGFLPSKDWKQEVKGERWYIGDTYHLAIGQGDLLVTPLQLITGVSAVANGGTRVQPHLVESINGLPVTYPSPGAERSLNTDSIQVIREGMRQTVTRGSAQSLSALAQPVAGKTGTAQTGGDRPNHAWFTGFGPYEHPDLAIIVLVEFGGEGSSVAVPIARDIFTWWFANR